MTSSVSLITFPYLLPGGRSDIITALQLIDHQIFVNDRNGVNDIIILMTDGKIYQDMDEIQAAIQDLDANDTDVEETEIYAVAIGENIDHDFSHTY